MISLTDNREANTGGFEAALGFHRTFREWAATRSDTIVRKKKKKKKKKKIGKNALSSESSAAEVATEEEEASRYPAPCLGEYTHMRPTEDADVMERMRHVPIGAGDAVFWDERIPHSNSYRHDGGRGGGTATATAAKEEPRAVIYCSFLPDIALNRDFAKRQAEDWKLRRRPRGDQWIDKFEDVDDNKAGGSPGEGGKANDDVIEEDDGTEPYTLNDIDRKLMGIDPW